MKKGAFTGAMHRRVGYLEEAGDGTLFLDEIGELSQHTQVKLLRVLQQREFTRLGSSVPIPLRARVLFATNRNLKQMVGEGAFREDLYYRVNVVGIHAPALRDRREDISQLARHFLTMYARSYGKNVTSIGADAMALLCDYAWPGNIRELENVIQSAIVLADDDNHLAVKSSRGTPARRFEGSYRRTVEFLRRSAQGLQSQTRHGSHQGVQWKQDTRRAESRHLAHLPSPADPRTRRRWPRAKGRLSTCKEDVRST